MGRANATVQFKDGTTLHGLYYGTSDVFHRDLHSTPEEAWEAYSERGGNPPSAKCWCDVPGSEAVVLSNDYGYGNSWAGEACKKCRCITKGFTDPYWDE